MWELKCCSSMFLQFPWMGKTNWNTRLILWAYCLFIILVLSWESKMFPPNASQLGWNSWDCTHPSSSTASEIYTNNLYSIILSFTVKVCIQLKLQTSPFFAIRKTCKNSSESNPLFPTILLNLPTTNLWTGFTCGYGHVGKKVLVLSIPYRFSYENQEGDRLPYHC